MEIKLIQVKAILKPEKHCFSFLQNLKGLTNFIRNYCQLKIKWTGENF